MSLIAFHINLHHKEFCAFAQIINTRDSQKLLLFKSSPLVGNIIKITALSMIKAFIRNLRSFFGSKSLVYQLHPEAKGFFQWFANLSKDGCHHNDFSPI